MHRYATQSEVGSDQALAQDKGVLREKESEGSRRQTSDLRNTNHIRHFLKGKTADQVKALKLLGSGGVNVAGTWRES